jgi:P pilus assembly chaperone PapD
LDDILNKIIPHFDNYPLQGSKRLDYLDFKRVALMMKDGLHLQAENQTSYYVHFQRYFENGKRSFERKMEFL